MMKMPTDACYARYSSHAQDGGTSIEVQLDACHRASGGECRDYIDEAKSGTAIAGRTALLKLLSDADAGHLSRVLVHKYDRLGRNLAETSAVIAQLKENGVEVVSVTEGRDALARGMHLVISEHYSRVLSERTREGLVKRHQQRAWTGGPPPFGYELYDSDRGLRCLRINDDEAATVRFIFQKYLAGNGMKAVAKKLQAKGIKPRRSRHWMHTSVRSILVNTIYRGEVRYGKREFRRSRKSGKRIWVRRPEKDVKRYHDQALRIISDRDFAAVQAKMTKRRSAIGRPRGGGLKRPLTGLVKCYACHSATYALKSHNRKGTYRYIMCGYRSRTSGGCSNSATLREDKILADITAVLGRLIDSMDGLIEEVADEARQRLTQNRQRIQELRRFMAEKDSEVARLAKELTGIEEPLAAKAIRRLIAGLQQEYEDAEVALSTLHERAGDTAERLAGEVKEAVKEIRDSLSNAHSERLREVLLKYVGPFFLMPDGTIAQNKEASAAEATEAHQNGLVEGTEPQRAACAA